MKEDLKFLKDFFLSVYQVFFFGRKGKIFNNGSVFRKI